MPVANELFYLRFGECRMTQADAADFLGIGVRTMRRQEMSTQPRPCYVRALRLRAGFLGDIHPAWHGFRLALDGCVYPPTYKHGFRPGEILAQFYQVQLIAHLEREIRKLQEANSASQRALTIGRIHQLFKETKQALNSAHL